MPVPDQLMFQVAQHIRYAYNGHPVSLYGTTTIPKLLPLQSSSHTWSSWNDSLSLSAVLKLILNLQRDSVDVWAHAARTNSSSLQRGHNHESIFLFKICILTHFSSPSRLNVIHAHPLSRQSFPVFEKASLFKLEAENIIQAHTPDVI
ncbi:hypothetical protein EDD22DRAFT_1053706 [Suillus occidentalis]|nr:hypothetical protein EDD22DRAFT_1053706 [Suillus occidentalis]